jgi:hypothetical protein
MSYFSYKEFGIVGVFIFCYIWVDISQYSVKPLPLENVDRLRVLKPLEKPHYEENVYLSISRNIWGLKDLEAEDNTLASMQYRVDKEHKRICFKNQCLELIGRYNNKIIFYSVVKHHFIEYGIGETILEDLKIVSLGEYVVLEDGKQTYLLDYGFVDLNLYKGKKSEAL